MGKPIFTFFLVFLSMSCIVSFLPVTISNAVTHTTKSRIQISGEVDDNIGEDSSNPLAGNALRFFSTIQGKGQLSPTIPYDYDMVVGYRGYRSYAQENRMVLQARSNLSRDLSGLLFCGITGNVFLEDYRTKYRDNYSIFSSLYLTLPQNVLKVFYLSFQIQPSATQYPDDKFFNFTDKGWSLDVRRKVNKRLTVLGGFTYRPRSYDRKALTKIWNTYQTQLLSAQFSQRDITNEYSAGVQYFRRFLLSAWFVFRNTNSNSYGFSNRENRFIVIAGSPFAFESMLKMYLTVESKHYDEKLKIPILTDIDEDKEEDNRLIIELSRDILPSLAFELRYEWFRNESRIRNLYYSKHVISSGLEYSF